MAITFPYAYGFTDSVDYGASNIVLVNYDLRTFHPAARGPATAVQLGDLLFLRMKSSNVSVVFIAEPLSLGPWDVVYQDFIFPDYIFILKPKTPTTIGGDTAAAATVGPGFDLPNITTGGGPHPSANCVLVRGATLLSHVSTVAPIADPVRLFTLAKPDGGNGQASVDPYSGSNSGSPGPIATVQYISGPGQEWFSYNAPYTSIASGRATLASGTAVVGPGIQVPPFFEGFLLLETPAPVATAAVITADNNAPVAGNSVIFTADVKDQYGNPNNGASANGAYINPSGTTVATTWTLGATPGRYTTTVPVPNPGSYVVDIFAQASVIGVGAVVAQPNPTQALVRYGNVSAETVATGAHVLAVPAGAVTISGSVNEVRANGVTATVPNNVQDLVLVHSPSGTIANGTATTDAGGTFPFTYTPPAGNVETSITATPRGGALNLPKIFLRYTRPAGTPTTLVLTPVSPTVTRGGSTTLVADVKDQYGNPSVGQGVAFYRRGPDATNVFLGYVGTDPSGRATVPSGALVNTGGYVFMAETEAVGTAKGFTAVVVTPATGDSVITTVLASIDSFDPPTPAAGGFSATPGLHGLRFFVYSQQGYSGRLVVKVLRNGVAQPDIVFGAAELSTVGPGGLFYGRYTTAGFTAAAGDTWEFVAFADPDGDGTLADVDSSPAVHSAATAVHYTLASGAEVVAFAALASLAPPTPQRGNNVLLSAFAETTAGNSPSNIGATASFSVLLPGATVFTPLAQNVAFSGGFAGVVPFASSNHVTTVAGVHIYRVDVSKGPGNTPIPAFTAVEVRPADTDAIATVITPVDPTPAVVPGGGSHGPSFRYQRVFANGTISPAALAPATITRVSKNGQVVQATTTDAAGIATASPFLSATDFATWVAT